MTVDHRCYELAKLFVSDLKAELGEKMSDEKAELVAVYLSGVIQECIEDYLRDYKAETA